MKHLITLLLSCFFFPFIYAQDTIVTSKIVSIEETETVVPDSVRKLLSIDYPIERIYECRDKTGISYIVLTESNDRITAEGDTLHYNIKAFKFLNSDSGLIKTWQIQDYRSNYNGNNVPESSIWFWNKYSSFTDIDGDKLVDPVLVYGTSGPNDVDDGRIKIIIFHKDKKIAIRHQNGVLDFERQTRIDKEFYTLPQSVQVYIKTLMHHISDNNLAIFPGGWEDGIKRKKVLLKESGY